MPIHMDISPINRLVVVVVRGHVTGDEISKSIRTFMAANVSGYGKIVDVTGAASELARDQVERIAALLRGDPDGPSRGAVAFVVAPERSGFAEAFADVTRGERPIELFRSLHAARTWLADAGTAAPPAARLHAGVPVRG